MASSAVALVIWRRPQCCAPKTRARRPRRSPPRKAGPLGPEEQLRRDLQSIFTDSAVDHAVWSVSVQSLKQGGTLYSLNSVADADTRVESKADHERGRRRAARLGLPLHARRFTRPVRCRRAAISTATWSSCRTAIRRSTRGIPIVGARSMRGPRQLYAKGIRRVGGHLIGDDNAFAEPGYGFGWSWDDLVAGYGAAVGALQYNENQIELMILPGPEAGGTRHHQPVAPGQRHAPGSRRYHRRGGTTVPHHRSSGFPVPTMLRVIGQVAIDSPPITELAAVPNPTHVLSERPSRNARTPPHLRRRQHARHRRSTRQARLQPAPRCCSRISRRRSMR